MYSSLCDSLLILMESYCENHRYLNIPFKAKFLPFTG